MEADAPTFDDLLRKLVGYLEFESPEPGVYFGRYGGYAMALTLLRGTDEDPIASIGGFQRPIDPPGSYARCGLLFQIRHVRDKTMDAPVRFNWGEEVSDLIEEGVAKITVEERTTWFSLYCAYEVLRFGLATVLLDTVLAELERTGHRALDGICHYCLQRPVASLTFDHGWVGQMCHACLAPYVVERASMMTPTRAGLLNAIILGIPGALLGAAAWTASWVVYDLVRALLVEYRIRLIPGVLVVAFVLVVAGMTGWVVASLIRRARRRGYAAAAGAGFVYSTFAVALGECALGRIVGARHYDDGVSTSAVRALLDFWRAMDWGHALLHIVAAIAAVAFGTALARPTIKRVPL